MDIFLTVYSKPSSKVARRYLFLVLCLAMWSCNSTPEEIPKEELALYNDLVDELAWQCTESCNLPHGSNAIVWSSEHGDSIRNIMRSQTKRRALYYQPKIGATYKSAQLSEWLTVELASWDRFFSTFNTTTPKNVVPSLIVSPALEAGQLNIDYVQIAQLDTALSSPPDSSTAVVRFSTPYYHEDRKRAVVYFESACGSKSGRGELLMLRYKENRWIIEERRKVWIK